MDEYQPPRLLAVDPVGCGCTECGRGEYVPLDFASIDQIELMLLGVLGDNTSATKEQLAARVNELLTPEELAARYLSSFWTTVRETGNHYVGRDGNRNGLRNGPMEK